MRNELYTVQVTTGRESRFAQHAEDAEPDGIRRIIFLQRRLNIRRGGKNVMELAPVFPGYVFLETGGSLRNGAFLAIKELPDFIRFLPSNSKCERLSSGDVDIVNSFLKFGTIAEPSDAYFDENDRIVITEGPLKGLEGLIQSVDRRKRRVRLVTDFMGCRTSVDLSYNVIEKKKDTER